MPRIESNPIIRGSGDLATAQSSVTTTLGRNYDGRDGSSSDPVTEARPSLRMSRYDGVTQATLDAVPGAGTGGQTIDQTAAIVGASKGTSASELQTIGVCGVAQNAGTSGQPDACAVFGHAWLNQTGAAGVAIGAAFAARLEAAAAATAAGLTGVEIQAQNKSGSDHTNSSSGVGSSRALLISAGSSAYNRTATGIKFHHPTGWAKFDVGIHFASNDGGSVVTSTFRDNSSSETSLDVEGSHTTGLDTSGATISGDAILLGSSHQMRFGSSGPLWRTGSGTPEGSITAPVGSLYTRTDGSTSTTLYVKTSGTGNTGWTAK